MLLALPLLPQLFLFFFFCSRLCYWLMLVSSALSMPSPALFTIMIILWPSTRSQINHFIPTAAYGLYGISLQWDAKILYLFCLHVCLIPVSELFLKKMFWCRIFCQINTKATNNVLKKYWNLLNFFHIFAPNTVFMIDHHQVTQHCEVEATCYIKKQKKKIRKLFVYFYSDTPK